MLREGAVVDNPNYDAVCFHAQQCAEKYLKAFMQETGLPINRTHNLLHLLHQLQAIDPDFMALQPHLLVLNFFSVNVRYPGENANESLAQEAMGHCRTVREVMRRRLGI